MNISINPRHTTVWGSALDCACFTHTTYGVKHIAHIRKMSELQLQDKIQNCSSCQKVDFNIFCTCNAFYNCNFFASYCVNTALDGDKKRHDKYFTFTYNYFDIVQKELQKWLKVPIIYDFKELKPPQGFTLGIKSHWKEKMTHEQDMFFLRRKYFAWVINSL